MRTKNRYNCWVQCRLRDSRRSSTCANRRPWHAHSTRRTHSQRQCIRTAASTAPAAGRRDNQRLVGDAQTCDEDRARSCRWPDAMFRSRCSNMCARTDPIASAPRRRHRCWSPSDAPLQSPQCLTREIQSSFEFISFQERKTKKNKRLLRRRVKTKKIYERSSLRVLFTHCDQAR